MVDACPQQSLGGCPSAKRGRDGRNPGQVQNSSNEGTYCELHSSGSNGVAIQLKIFIPTQREGRMLRGAGTGTRRPTGREEGESEKTRRWTGVEEGEVGTEMASTGVNVILREDQCQREVQEVTTETVTRLVNLT